MEAGQRREGDGKSPLELLCWLISLSRVKGHPPGLSVPAKEPQDLVQILCPPAVPAGGTAVP